MNAYAYLNMLAISVSFRTRLPQHQQVWWHGWPVKEIPGTTRSHERWWNSPQNSCPWRPANRREGKECPVDVQTWGNRCWSLRRAGAYILRISSKNVHVWGKFNLLLYEWKIAKKILVHESPAYSYSIFRLNTVHVISDIIKN